MKDIKIGLTGWGDHHTLYEQGYSPSNKLESYAAHFPIVELDSSFYAIPPQRNLEKWVRETPASFEFIVKAYQGMTGHQRGEISYDSKKEMFQAFTNTFLPLKKEGKLAMVLCQFPPWFDCQKKHVDYLRYARQELIDFEVALEFRHQSWYQESLRESTLEYMRNDEWIHSICDEPQVGERSVPFVPVNTSDEKAFIRLHGRNKAAWNKPVTGEAWREVRYLYDYSKAEIDSLARQVNSISGNVKKTYIVFNNNSGGHAADNAKSLISNLHITYNDLAPRQLNLFDE
ncbi:hypothetical protein CR203_20605 [Salipaludibacillus neizhouensis]|uniref:DUF72 domain-containing protein n=1 Tax=Salipaludibacillus neizhouensis TaxID=885475 RepID=A0A3A9K3M0_9BACI|nr:DUF72 domain-containing protein [Salipaludibacillus neizhouensis]RKL65480.1 hypothetical protein CR203_20605 [Salipaludibacillus neizhouensis]